MATAFLSVLLGAPTDVPSALVPEVLVQPDALVNTLSAAAGNASKPSFLHRIAFVGEALKSSLVKMGTVVAEAEERVLVLKQQQSPGLQAAIAELQHAREAEQLTEAAMDAKLKELLASERREQPVAPIVSGVPLWRDVVISDRVAHVRAEIMNPALLALPHVVAQGSHASHLVVMRREMHSGHPFWPTSSMNVEVFDSGLVFGWLATEAGAFRLQGATQTVTDEALFPGAPFDCLQASGPEGVLQYGFGLEDPRLLMLEGELHLLVHTRHHSPQPAQRCNRRLGEGLQPYLVPLQVQPFAATHECVWERARMPIAPPTPHLCEDVAMQALHQNSYRGPC